MTWGAINCICTEHNLSTGLYTTLRILKIQYLRVLKGILHKIDKGFIHRNYILWTLAKGIACIGKFIAASPFFQTSANLTMALPCISVSSKHLFWQNFKDFLIVLKYPAIHIGTAYIRECPRKSYLEGAYRPLDIILKFMRLPCVRSMYAAVRGWNLIVIVSLWWYNKMHLKVMHFRL